jgi:hypothetical protein
VTEAERTYSFRAPRDFGTRLLRARRDFRLIAADAELSADFGREFPLALLRRRRQLDEESPDGVFARTVADAFASATERVRSEHERMREFAAIDRP